MAKCGLILIFITTCTIGLINKSDSSGVLACIAASAIRFACLALIGARCAVDASVVETVLALLTGNAFKRTKSRLIKPALAAGARCGTRSIEIRTRKALLANCYGACSRKLAGRATFALARAARYAALCHSILASMAACAVAADDVVSLIARAHDKLACIARGARDARAFQASAQNRCSAHAWFAIIW